MSNRAMSTLIGTVITQIGLGSIYAYSFYNLYLANKTHANVTTVAIAFGIAMLFLSIGSSLAGKLQTRFGVRKVILIAAILFLIGSIITAHTTSVWLVYLGIGVLIGVADGFGYLMTLSNCVKWFPNKRGIAAACSIGSYGIGALVFKYIFVDAFPSFGLSNTLELWGGIVFVLLVISSFFHFDHTPEQTAHIKVVEKTKGDGTVDFTLPEALSTSQYRVLAFMFFSAMMSGLYALGLARDLGVGLAHLDPVAATSAITVVAIFNLIGRFVMGILSDKAKRLSLIKICHVFTIIGMLLILFTTLNIVTFYIAIALLAFAFGGYITIFPPLMSEFYGLKNLTKNYGLLYLGFGISSIIASIIAGVTGGYQTTFYVILVLNIIGLICALVIKKPLKSDKKLAVNN